MQVRRMILLATLVVLAATCGSGAEGQPSQHRYQRWFGLLVVLVMLVAVPVVLAAHHYQQGVAGECALRFEADKTRLDDDRHHWDWWPPGWVCAFEQDGRR